MDESSSTTGLISRIACDSWVTKFTSRQVKFVVSDSEEICPARWQASLLGDYES